MSKRPPFSTEDDSRLFYVEILKEVPNRAHYQQENWWEKIPEFPYEEPPLDQTSFWYFNHRP